MNLEEKNYLGIGTLESYEKLKAYYGEEKIRPIYIEVEDGERLKRAIAREETQEDEIRRNVPEIPGGCSGFQRGKDPAGRNCPSIFQYGRGRRLL